MSNQAFSESNDLQVGAGELYFKRSDDVHGFHHLGDAQDFNITNDVTKVEHNSSMNKARELMDSVVTAVKSSAKVKLFEYNAYNLALGLFGAEGVEHQAAVSIVDEAHTVVSVPGIIQLKDADGNTYYNLSAVTMKPHTPVPATAVFRGTTSDTYTDALGGTLKMSIGTFAGTSDERVFITVKTAPTATGDLNGLELEVKEGIIGSTQPFNVSSTATTKDFILTSGLKITATVTGTHTFTASATLIEADVTAATTTYTAGKDYTFESQSGKAGFIKINPNGIIKEADVVLISATVPEQTFVTVSGANAGDIEGELLYVSDNNAGGNTVVEAWKVKVTPDGELSGLISSDFGSFSLGLQFLSDKLNHPKYPFYKVTYTDKATGSATTQGVYDPLN